MSSALSNLSTTTRFVITDEAGDIKTTANHINTARDFAEAGERLTGEKRIIKAWIVNLRIAACVAQEVLYTEAGMEGNLRSLIRHENGGYITGKFMTLTEIEALRAIAEWMVERTNVDTSYADHSIAERNQLNALNRLIRSLDNIVS